MAKTTRHWAKRKLEMAKGNIDNTGQHLFAVSEVYEANHPEISNKIIVAMAILAELEKIIDSINKGI